MKKTISLILILLLPALLVAQINQNRAIVFNRVTIIDVKNPVSKSEMNVIIKGDRIAATGKTGKLKTSKDAEIIDAHLFQNIKNYVMR